MELLQLLVFELGGGRGGWGQGLTDVAHKLFVFPSMFVSCKFQLQRLSGVT